jgi:hypothetical protein
MLVVLVLSVTMLCIACVSTEKKAGEPEIPAFVEKELSLITAEDLELLNQPVIQFVVKDKWGDHAANVDVTILDNDNFTFLLSDKTDENGQFSFTPEWDLSSLAPSDEITALYYSVYFTMSDGTREHVGFNIPFYHRTTQAQDIASYNRIMAAQHQIRLSVCWSKSSPRK